jgi:hypothetical protein
LQNKNNRPSFFPTIFPTFVCRDFSYISQSAYALYSNLAQDLPGHEGYHRLKESLMRRYLIPHCRLFIPSITTVHTCPRLGANGTISWIGTPAGHHVSGKLVFPATKDGKPILEGATKLTLTILNVDVPSRLFEWMLK